MSINSMSKSTRWAATVVLASALVYPAPLAAQSITCDQARKTLLAANSKRAALFSAGSHMLGCLSEAPGTIASGLRRATPGTVQDTVLQQGAYLLNDRRLVDSVRALAVDQSQALARRRLYLQLLTRYISPGTSIDMSAASAEKLLALVGSGDEESVTGAQPIDEAARVRALGTIYSMKQSDSDTGLRTLANMVYHELYRRRGGT